MKKKEKIKYVCMCVSFRIKYFIMTILQLMIIYLRYFLLTAIQYNIHAIYIANLTKFFPRY